MASEDNWGRIHGHGDRRDSADRGDILPQQPTLESIVTVVRHHDLPMDELRQLLVGGPVDPRIVGYYRTSAKILGLLDRDLIPTPSGRALLCLEPEQQVQRMAYAFEACPLGQAWLAFQGCTRLEELESSARGPDLLVFLRHYLSAHDKSYAKDTLESRANTLRKWLSAFIVARRQIPLPDVERRPRLEDAALPSNTPAIFDTKVSGEVLEHLARGSGRVEVATAYFSLGGYARVAEQLDTADMYLLIGSDERSGNDVKFLLRQFAASLQQRYDELGGELGNRRRIIQKLHAQLVRGRVRVRRFEARQRTGLHAKVYIFDRDRAYLGSANLTANGLASNVECGRVIRAREEVEYLAARFELFFAKARPFSEPLMRKIEESWALWEPADPYLVLLKILDLLFGHIQPVDSRRYHLADYQQAVVATVLRRFESQARVMLIAPTGIGKTVMGAYIAAALQARGQIHRVIIVSKNQSMREMWTEALRSFRLCKEDIRTYDLERATDGVGREPRLAEVFVDLGADDLVIVDECHHFRRGDSQRQASLEEFLQGPDPVSTDPRRPEPEPSRGDLGSAPMALLMTATPISTGLDNLQTLLHMVTPDEGPLEEVTDIAEHRGAVNVALGQVFKDFGKKKGAYIGLTLQDELRFFPKLNLWTTKYPSDMDEIFEALAQMDFTLENQWGASSVADLGDDDEDGAVTGRHGFIRALIARRAESSLVALNVTLDRLAEGVMSGRLLPANVERFNAHIDELMVLAEDVRGRADRKLRALLSILRKQEPGTKVIIFTEYRATADYLCEQLEARLSNPRIAKVTGELDAQERRKVFRAFAPIAQRVTQLPHERYDILVATDAISEGENLQDAEYVINYDLSWTPLRLIQRVGRVNRFTEDKRKVYVRNFFPGTDSYERIVTLRARLMTRGQQVLALSGVDYLEDGEQTPVWLASRSVAAVTKFYARKSRTLTWAELLKDAGELPSTRGPAQLWAASPKERRQARGLPDGIQGCAYGQHPGLYLLLEVDGNKIALRRDDRSGSIQSAPQPSSHEQLLGALKDITPREGGDVVALDRAVGDLVREWLADGGYSADMEVMVLAALHVFACQKAELSDG